MNSLCTYRVLLSALTLALSCAALADSITVNGETYARAYVRESGQRYYVQIPDTGKVLSFPKSAVRAEDVQISKDPAEREQILKEWQAKSSPSLTPVSPSPQPATPNASSRSPVATPAETPDATEHGQRITLRNVKLRDALKAMLRSHNLDFAVRNGQIWVSTPERLRTESFEDMETRVYSPKGLAMNGTLPKVVLQTPPQTGLYSNGSQAVMGGGMAQSGNMGYGGGMAQSGNIGYGGGSQMQQGYQPMGNMGGMGGGMQGGGGYAQGFQGGGFYGNITELIRPFDDRMVGETPAAVGSVMFLQAP